MAGKHGSRSKRLLCVHSQEVEREKDWWSAHLLFPLTLLFTVEPHFKRECYPHSGWVYPLQSLGDNLTHTHTEVCFLGASKPSKLTLKINHL